MNINKGYIMEENLRQYFRELGYFVVRGVNFRYEGFDVTDIDLWLYMKQSTLTRERINVDIKNKKTPQAIERIFWNKGLQIALGLEKCMIATTDERPSVNNFGIDNDVIVLDGSFLSRLSKIPLDPYRLIEEDFIQVIDIDDKGKNSVFWRKRINESKSLLLTQLDYSGCNYWLGEIYFFANQIIISHQRRESACRIMYLLISYLLIGIDFIYKDLSSLDSQTRINILNNGFLHGSLGENGTKKIVEMALQLIRDYMPQNTGSISSLKRNLEEVYSSIPVNILSDYFSKSDIVKNLFNLAISFEKLAYNKTFYPLPSIDNDLQSIIGVILDFYNIERRTLFEAFE
ncbi:MAG: hypothetical protein LCH85_24960 [Chloroflexi bacterium]|nr:hypothetical protein [Chloroflexota bacterium]